MKMKLSEYAAYFVGGPADGATGMVRPDWDYCYVKDPDEKDSRFAKPYGFMKEFMFLKCSDLPEGDRYKILHENAAPKYCDISAAERVAIWEAK